MPEVPSEDIILMFEQGYVQSDFGFNELIVKWTYASYPHNLSIEAYVKESIDKADPRDTEVIHEVQMLRLACIRGLGSPISKKVALVCDLGIQITVSVVWEAKLLKWCPDPTSGSFKETTYNLVHEELAIQLFRHLVLNTNAYK